MINYSSNGTTPVMSDLNSASVKNGNKATFWKKNAKNVPGSIKPVYGAQHPPIVDIPSESQQGTPKKTMMKSRDSFQDFQDNTSDAWDDGDDDLIQMANIKMSLRDVHSTALAVINSHSQQAQQQKRIESTNGARASENMPSKKGITPLSKAETTSTPTHTPHHTGSAGPGVGVRLSTTYHTPKKNIAVKLGQMPVPDREASKLEKIKSLLTLPSLDMDELRKLSWSGLPRQVRPIAWKLLSGYIPPILDRRELTLERKRKEYLNFIEQYYHTRHEDLHKDTFRQIHIDIPRMNPLMPVFQQSVVQEIFERILYIWAIRHPASGYVQGMNDLVTPFFVVFLSEYIDNDVVVDNCDLSQLPQRTLEIIEADSFWCMSKLLDGIQDNYTFAQPGIQLKVNTLADLIKRTDLELYEHLRKQNVEFLQFAFRWMNNLLMREFPLRCTIRVWDTYQSEPEGFASFHLYLCAAFLLHFSDDAKREKDFQGLLLLLQNLPTHHWDNEQVGLLLAEAFKLKYMFADAPNHLGAKQS